MHASVTTSPTISVVVNNFNYARYLPEALDSVLSQIEPHDELIVVDDGSVDESSAVLARYAGNPQVTVILQHNQGQLVTVLNGLAAAQGALCVLLDSDDYLLPGHLARLRGNAQEYPDENFFFAAAQPGGENAASAVSMRETLAKMEVPAGATGVSRWSTWAGGEFLGTPTSGLALRDTLVARLLALRSQLHDEVHVAGWAIRLFGMKKTSHVVSRLSADGVLVRASSLLGARKHYCGTPGFFYRIHGTNAFAGLGTAAHIYLRITRKKQIALMVSAALDIPSRPPLQAVRTEAAQRSRPLRLKRRLTLWINYSRAMLCAAGPLAARLRSVVQLPRLLFSQGPTQAK